MSDEIQNLCRKCGTNLSQEYLEKLSRRPDVAFACPNLDCDHVHFCIPGGFDQIPRAVARTTGRKLDAN